jgi:hypothetical protein
MPRRISIGPSASKIGKLTNVRLMGKHRICFTVSLETGGALYITITAIGEPTYEH